MNDQPQSTEPPRRSYAHEEARPNVLHRIGAFFALRDDDVEDESATIEPAEAAPPPRRNVISFSSSRDAVRRPTNEVGVFAPSAFADVTEIADALRARQVVIVNVLGVDRTLLQRIVDFCSGVAYTLDGRMKRLADGMYLVVPPGISVNSEGLREQLGVDPALDILAK